MDTDESKAPGEAYMWLWVFELVYHHEMGGTLLDSWRWASAARLSATCIFAVMVAPSVEKFTFVTARAMSSAFCEGFVNSGEL